MAYQAAHSASAVKSNGGGGGSGSGGGSGGMEDSNIAPSFSARQFLGRTAPDIVRTSSHTE